MSAKGPTHSTMVQDGSDVLDFQISGPVPAGLSTLANLSVLSMANNSLSGTIPSAFFTNLQQLVILDLDDNSLQVMAWSITGLLTMETNRLSLIALLGCV